MTDASRCLCLVDPSLRDQVGHYFEYARTIAQSARDAGVRFVALGNRQVQPEIARALPVEPAFARDLWHKFVTIPRAGFALDPIAANASFYRDLSASLGGRAGADWTLFAPTVDHRQLLAFALWLLRRPPAAAPALVVLLRYSYFIAEPPRWERTVHWARLGLRLLARLGRTYRVRLATDSARLAREYAPMSALPVEVLPIPHTTGARVAGPGEAPPAVGGRVRFVSLGDARTEKGFALLAEAIGRLHEQGEAEGMEFALQCNVAGPTHEAVRACRQGLADLRLPHVSLITEPLNTLRYTELLESAHVVLVPYRRAVYYARTSGPFTEALAAAKPVVTTDDTWMSEQLKGTSAGITFRDGDAGDLARAIRDARDRLPQLSMGARELRGRWIDFHNPTRFFQMLMGS